MTEPIASRGKQGVRYSARDMRLSWPLLAGIAVFHLGLFYVLLRALAPAVIDPVERQVIAAFDVEMPHPPAPPPESRSEPDQGAQGQPGKQAVATAVTAPPAPLPIPSPQPLPQAASTGSATQSGARDSGEGTGAYGSGLGTGGGNAGRGQGGVAVTRPVHISGGIDNARDYPTPPGGRHARRGSEVIVRLVVGTDGRGRDCSIYRASPDAEADRITCQLVEERLRFRPAQDANGNLVEAPFYWRQQWF